jgi:hypothetical protein
MAIAVLFVVGDVAPYAAVHGLYGSHFGGSDQGGL